MMSEDEGGRASGPDIQQVKIHIELCIQSYMSKNEVMDTLTRQFNIEPCFTELVWERLEKDNQEFFKAYHIKLLLRDQITKFNQLLLKQVELMNLTSNDGSHVISTQQISAPSAAQSARPPKTNETDQLNVHDYYGQSILYSEHGTFDLSVHSRESDVSPNMLLSRCANFGLAQTGNDQIVKTEADGDCGFDFCPPNNFVESHPQMGDASTSPYSNVASNAQHPNNFHLDWDACLWEQYQDTCTPELIADFTSNSTELTADFTDLPGSCDVPPNLAMDTNSVDPCGAFQRLNPASERFFGTD